jgi:L-ascorbate metabolism protein UlaG (beta-lactamase superfamily)
MTERPILARLAFARRYAGAAARARRGERCPAILPAPFRPDPAAWSDDRLTAAWLGHATVLLNFLGSRILTDPALEPRVGIGRGRAKLGPRRLVAPALRPRDLPPLDLLVLSHAHMDHTDLGTLASLPRDVPVLVQPGNRDLVRRFRNVTELGWGESTEIGGIEVESIEVRHWGARMVTDRHRGYGGFLLRKDGRAVVFAGDTAYTDSFGRLRSRGPIDLAILPIGAYDPWIYNHASPEEAWRMFRSLGAGYLLPIHHSTFRLSREPVDEPVRRLLAAAGEEGGRVALTEVGATWAHP